ncbi:5'-3' exonuclease, C-terminal domain-containing protein, partial [Cynara cardunculus var. scolymus]
MGVGGNFWDLLKPYARTEGFDFLRNKRVAIDLSYWIVQHETAIKAHTRNPHLRLTFFRTINLFSKFGAFPVFVADGTPSPLKSQARIMRFLQASGIDLTSVQLADGTSVERNRKASGEAEGLCAQLNREGREPFECYQMSDVEGGLGLKRNHLIAIALLVGNDHDLKGVQGIGIETALSFVKLFGSGNTLTMTYVDDSSHNSDVNTTRMRVSHCSLCGHPGSKRSHLKDSCECCSSSTIKGCTQKPIGFTCDCSSCDMDKKEKEQTKKEAWKTRVCKKIAAEPNFPNDAIIQMYLSNNHSSFTDAEPFISWKNPSTEMLVDYVAYKLNWEPSFIRQKLFPLLSTVFLRNITKNQETDLLFGQYEFDFIQRTKMRFGHTFYVVIWKKSAKTVDNRIYEAHAEEEAEVEEDLDEVDHVVDIFDEPDVTNVRVDNGCLTTDENRDLVMAAYPEKVDQFMQEKESKEMKSRKKSRAKSPS